MIFDRKCRLSRKWYKTGPWLLWITNRKSHVADRSMTFSDLEKRDARGRIFPGRSPELRTYHWLRKTKFGKVIRKGGAYFYGSSTSRFPASPMFGTPTYAHSIWRKLTKFDMVTYEGRGVFKQGQARSPFQRVGLQNPKFWGPPIHALTQYDTQQTNFAWRSIYMTGKTFRGSRPHPICAKKILWHKCWHMICLR